MKKLFLLLFTACVYIQLHATIHTITVQNFVFTPNSVSANCGDTVRFSWINGTHPVVSETATWTTFTMSSGFTTKDIIITTAGTYAYYCDFHGDPGGVGMSGSITVTCTPPPCDTPTGVTAMNVTSSSAKIKWTAATGATQYNLQYRVLGTMAWTKKNSATTAKNLTGLTAATTYQYRVRSFCGAGVFSPYSALQTFTTLTLKEEAPIVVEDHSVQLGIYPNPNAGEFQLVMEHVHADEVIMRIYDLTGRIIMEQNLISADDAIVQTIKLPDGFSGKAIVKIECMGKELISEILVQ
ncbi:MAG: fibronectin type III domain-containing protein [Fimbriimonadaceae bacterium]|nr:fibronectin type III domain-containing protein [Chitinophagales bacterium]